MGDVVSFAQFFILICNQGEQLFAVTLQKSLLQFWIFCNVVQLAGKKRCFGVEVKLQKILNFRRLEMNPFFQIVALQSGDSEDSKRNKQKKRTTQRYLNAGRYALRLAEWLVGHQIRQCFIYCAFRTGIKYKMALMIDSVVSVNSAEKPGHHVVLKKSPPGLET